MKKIIIGILAIAIIAVGCLLFLNNGKGDTDHENNTPNVQENDNKEKNMKDVNVSFNYKGADITPGKSFNSKSIAEEAMKSTLPSCAFEGEDNVYTYSNIEVTANVSGKKETIYSVYFIDDSVETNEGVKIGDSKGKMLEVYGDNYLDDGNDSLVTYRDKKGDKDLVFEIQDDTITGISYILVLN